jgi:hypothetical protein
VQVFVAGLRLAYLLACPSGRWRSRSVTALIKRAIEQDRFPYASRRFDPLRSALAKLDPPAAAALRRPLEAKNTKPAPHYTPSMCDGSRSDLGHLRFEARPLSENQSSALFLSYCC